nr:hypothetical protein [uncultured Holophaga sp.]
MRKLSAGGQKALNVVHLTAASVWTACVLLLLLFPRLVGPDTPDEGVRMFVALYRFTDILVLSPAATVTVLTGLAYALFTPWGFRRHGWVLLKWIISLGLVIWGTVHLGPSVDALLAWSRETPAGLARDPRFLGALRLATGAAICNTLLLFGVIAISVFKPWKNLGSKGQV